MKRTMQKLIAAGVLALMLLLIPISTYAEFRYLDRVVVVRGFYRGGSGAVQQKVGNKYRIKLLPLGTVIMVSGDEIQLGSRNQGW